MQFDEFGNVKGRFLYLDVHKAPLFNNEGELIGLVGSARDITERKQSEKTISMLAHAIRSVSECVSITDMEDRILFVNNAFLKTYQYDEQELTGKHISIVRSPKNKHDSVEVILPATLNGGWHGELINRRKDGSEFPVYLSTSVIQDESGKPVGLIGVTTDITDRKRAEQQLQESEARNKALLSAIPDLMFMFDRVGNFTDYHVRDPKLLMLNPEYFLNRNISDVLPEELAEQTKEHLSEVFETGKTSVFEYPLPIGDENNIYESRIVSCGQDRALSIVRDITDQKKMESQMIQSERLAALGEMLAGMAHEINQPLNTLSMLFDNILFEAHQEHAVKEAYLVTKSEKIVNNIQRIRNIIDHVREFAREHEQEEPEPFNINESIANALSMVSEQYKMAGIEIRTSFSDNLPMVRGNTFKFERIILNMILNSKDALLEKKDSLNEPYRMYVRINTSFKAKVVKIEVEDNGCGIREEHLHKVLQPFYTTKETGKGTGLGLSISYGLIREMNGNIDIQSKVMKGTRIIISIPYQTK
jgi:PAS domain S-box-containing protein